MKCLTFQLFIWLTVLPGFTQTFIIDEDFENFTTGTVPGSPWVMRFSGDSALVSEDIAISGIKSFKQANHSSWARVDAVPLSDINDYMLYEGWVFVNQTDRGGVIGFGFTESGNTYRYRNAIAFGNDGNIYFRGYDLQEYKAQMWYKIMVYCDFKENKAKVWINDTLKISDALLSTKDELTDFCIGGNNFSGTGSGIMYFDDVKLYIADFNIKSIEDVPNDQGRQVRINWKAHYFDKKLNNGLPLVTGYSIWRLIDDQLGFPKLNTAGDWDFITTIPAVQDSDYNMVVPTLADSNDKMLYMSVFLIRAHTNEVLEHWETQPDSGYSIDNLSPAKVDGLIAEILNNQDIKLSWNESPEKDFSHYNIYRGEQNNFVADEPLYTTDIVTFTDSGVEQKTYYYKISSVDFNGNESEYSDEISVIITDLKADQTHVKKFDLMQNYPNPFNPVTTIRYQLAKTSDVEISIFDSQGQKLQVVLQKKQNEGSYQVSWNASDFSTGVYFYRIRAGNFNETRKMLLIK